MKFNFCSDMMQSIQYAWLDVGPEGNLTAYERQNESPYGKGKVNLRQKTPQTFILNCVEKPRFLNC